MSRTAVAFGVTAFATAVAFQVGPRDVVLRAANATLAEPFTNIYSVRELSDGRVLVSDNSVESRLVVADLAANRVRMLGHIGAGPGEYRQAGRLLALSHDSTLFVDAARGRRLLLLHRDNIVTTLPPDAAVIKAVGGEFRGADTLGRVLGVRQMGADQLAPGMIRERLAAIVAQRSGARADTILSLRGTEQRITRTGTRERPFWLFDVLIGSVEDQATLFPDGWISVVRADPYRVEWRSPDGRVTQGPVVEWERPRGDEREKAAYLERSRRRYGSNSESREMPWADRLSPFRSNAMLPAPGGNLLVLRSQWSKAPDTRYDLFNRAGQLIGRLAMPDSERVVGFGPHSVYVTARDQDGFHRLRRHPWP